MNLWNVARKKEDIYKEFNFSGLHIVWSVVVSSMTQLAWRRVLRTVSRGMLLFLVGRWVAPSGRDLLVSVFTVRVMKICDLTDNRPQKAVTSVLYKPADTCHSSVY